MDNLENKTCRNCKNQFTIEPEDFEFYDKIKVLAPTFCPECRYQRRISHRNERVLYKRKCSATNKNIISIYPENSPFPVYDQKYWEGGNWDAIEYSRDFDFSRPFFEQFKELQQVVPRPNLRNSKSINSEYTNQCEQNKDCYLLVSSAYSENVMHSMWSHYCKDTSDIYSVLEGQWCYEIIHAVKANKVLWSMFVDNSFNCYFSYDLKNCNNCFLSYNLRNKSYYWANKQLSKKEWTKKFNEIKFGSFNDTELLKKKWLSIMKKALHKFAFQVKTVDSVGNILVECKNVKNSFNATRVENAKYCQDIVETKDCFDSTEFGISNCELNYELHGSATISRSLFSSICWESYEILYCDLCRNSHNLFGCISLKNKSYCILNKQYNKEEYEKLVPKIIEHMKKTEEYGNFFPTKISPFSYNETTAMEYFPLTKKDVLSKGWKWKDNIPVTYDKGTIKMEDIPNDIKDIDDSILKEILSCIDCGKNYRIIKQELDFYKKMILPIPRRCPDCRHYNRLALRNPRKLWKRNCDCRGEYSKDELYANKIEHSHHGDKHCPNEFETTYSPERSEVVYCEKCYLSEII